MANIDTKTFTGVKSMPTPDDAGIRWVSVDVEFPSTGPASGDLIRTCKIPVGVKVVDWAVVFPDIDSGTPAFATSLGVVNAGATDLGTEVWATGLTAGQSTTIARNTTSIAAQGDSTVERAIAFKVTTIAATYAGSGKTGQLLLALVG